MTAFAVTIILLVAGFLLRGAPHAVGASLSGRPLLDPWAARSDGRRVPRMRRQAANTDNDTRSLQARSRVSTRRP